jgi:hypothetical protein
MKTFRNVFVAMTSVVVVAGISGCSLATPSLSASLPRVAEVTAAVNTRIANDLNYEMAAAKQYPRVAQAIRTASVEITEMSDVVVVVASRLPPVEHFADAVAANVAP